MSLMKTVPVSDLRYHFPRVEKLLSSGEEIFVTKRGRVIGRIQADSEQVQADFGDHVLSVTGAEIISADRDDR